MQTLKIIVLYWVTCECSKSLCWSRCSRHNYVVLWFCCFAIFFLLENILLFLIKVAILTVLLLHLVILKYFVLWEILKQIGKLWKFLFNLAFRFTYSVVELINWCWSWIRKIPVWKTQIFKWNLFKFCWSFVPYCIQWTSLITNS